MLKNLFFLLFSTFTFSQTYDIAGIVSSEKNIPLEASNIIAKPLEVKASLKFAITDNKGRFRLELDKNVKYEIMVSYIGFIDEILIVEPNSSIYTHNFTLKSSGEQLKEIVIKYDFQPLIIKKDTLIFDVKSFANGNERKMKEILEKLPGVEVDKHGTVTVQGKKVTRMLVEGKSFFGGGSKLAVENIPADALDKIEVIDHFNEVGFMKQVSDSEDLAMNVKLKADKQKFVFGDVEAGLGVGVDKSNLVHAGLFYYTPKLNLSYIGDINNIGKSTFSFSDLMRFSGGSSSYLSKRKSLANLYSFTNDNTDFIQNKSQFSALNFSYNTSAKLSISGFAIFSKVSNLSRIETQNEYLENDTQIFENKIQNGNNKSILGISNFKLDYSPNKKEKIFYNFQHESSTNDLSSTLNSITSTNTNSFKTTNNADNLSFKQYIEWHKNYSTNHTTTLVINQTYENSTPENHWFTNQPFLAGLIPLQEDENYIIQQLKKVKTNTIDAIFKHYWIINSFNHLYTNIGNNFETSNYNTSEEQLLTNGTINDFSLSGFGNSVNYKLNDSYIGLEYKFKIKKWTNKAGLYMHLYNLKTEQSEQNYNISKTLIQPQWNSDYEFNQSEKINFSYKLVNNFPDVNQLANKYTLQYYNSVYKGNALLENEYYHSANLIYSKINMFRGISWNSFLSYVKKEKNIRNSVETNGINQYSTPILTDNPETNISFNGMFSKKIYRFNLKFNANLSWLNYTQTLNNITTINDRNNQDIRLTLKTAYKKWPDLSISYKKGFSNFSGLTKSNYQSDAINGNLEFAIFKFWTYQIEYDNIKNTNNRNQDTFYEVVNSSLRFQRKNSPFEFEFRANNLFDVRKKNTYSFSDYIISQQNTYILPRILLFSISYKL